jgi:transcription antitermination factor NusG
MSGENHDSDFAVGQRIRLVTGLPLKNVAGIGIITSVDRENRRLTAEFVIFGRTTPVELQFAAAEPIGNSS